MQMLYWHTGSSLSLAKPVSRELEILNKCDAMLEWVFAINVDCWYVRPGVIQRRRHWAVQSPRAQLFFRNMCIMSYEQKECDM